MARKKIGGGNVVAVSEGALDPKHFLGRLATYTLPDEPINGSKLVRSWHKHGLDVNDLPDSRQPAHIFQSACRSVETRTRNNGSSVEIKVDEVLNNSAECVYQITRMVRDKAEKLIEHPKAMRLTFDKALGTITVDALEDYKNQRGLEDAIRSHFDKNAKKIPGQKIRNAVRDTLLQVGAQNLRRKAGGLYFVPATYTVNDEVKESKPILDGLAGVLEDLYGDEKADFYTIPLVNDEGQRAMVRKHFVINVNERAADLMEKALNRVRAGKSERGVRSDLIANMVNERRRIQSDVEKFRKLVGDEFKDLRANLKDLDSAISDLVALADEGGNGKK